MSICNDPIVRIEGHDGEGVYVGYAEFIYGDFAELPWKADASNFIKWCGSISEAEAFLRQRGATRIMWFREGDTRR